MTLAIILTVYAAAAVITAAWFEPLARWLFPGAPGDVKDSAIGLAALVWPVAVSVVAVAVTLRALGWTLRRSPVFVVAAGRWVRSQMGAWGARSKSQTP